MTTSNFSLKDTGYLCSICLDCDIGKTITLKNCNHSFHLRCLRKCEKQECPLCREKHNVKLKSKRSETPTYEEFSLTFSSYDYSYNDESLYDSYEFESFDREYVEMLQKDMSRGIKISKEEKRAMRKAMERIYTHNNGATRVIC